MSAIQGQEKLQQKLRTLGPRVEKKVARRAINRGASVFVKKIRAEAPVGETKSIKKEVGKRVNAKKPGEITAKAGLGVGKKRKKAAKQAEAGNKRQVDASEPHGHLVAKGTKARYTGERTWKTKRGKVRRRSTGKPRAYRGKMTANGFVRRGASGAKDEFAAIVAKTLKDGIEQEAKK